MEQLDFDLLLRLFLGLSVDDPVRNHATFSTNRDRLLEDAIAVKFLDALLNQPRVKRLLFDEKEAGRISDAL